MRVAMVCLGNICRSPMAEAVGRAMIQEAGLGDDVRVESYGTAGYHRGEGADRRAVEALRRRGWPPGDHRARQLTGEALAAADLVLCADHANLAEVRRLADTHPPDNQRPADNHPPDNQGPADNQRPADNLETPDGGTRNVQRDSHSRIRLLRSFDPDAAPGDDEVPDPWGGGPDGFDHALDLIERACRGLVAELARAPR